MKSIKPGRGPSMMSAAASVFVAIFGVIWTVIACSIGGGPIAIFGIFFVLFALASAAYNFMNATRKNRFSSFDITDQNEEADPLNLRFSGQDNRATDQNADPHTNAQNKTGKSNFCPYCGNAVEADFQYCNYCGKKLPE